jgi:hypothetical protein
MESQDEYLVYVKSNGMRFYCKNKDLHRENGPAIVSEQDNAEYEILDKHLYKEVAQPYAKWPHIKVERYKNLYTNIVFSTSCGPNYYLNGISYSKEDFDIIILKNKLEKELPYNLEQPKKAKI